MECCDEVMEENKVCWVGDMEKGGISVCWTKDLEKE